MKTVICGMSGGVDSSVAALLLKQQGYNVIGCFMKNWEETDENGCCTAEDDYEDVRRVCEKIGIPYYTINFAKEYMENVFEYFLDEYKKGRTPNPDVLCNREIKFGAFLDYVNMMKADFIATGHYCGIEHKDGIHYLKNCKDENKDQTYFLNQLSQKQLEKVLFPLQDLTKPEVRQIAKENGLLTFEKKDSTGICFIGERKFKQFLQNYLPNKPGKICDMDNNVIGTHDGLMYYTLGQRKGLNIGGKAGGNGDRWFVIEKDLKNNILYVNQGEHEKLFSSYLITYNVNWIPNKPQEKEFDCYAKFRYRQPNQKVHVIIEDNFVKVEFYEKQRAVTPGQYVVFYQDDYCLGGGVIEEVFN